MSHPTGSNGRSAEKGFFFVLWKNSITDVSLFASYCYFIQEARHRLRKKRNQLFGTTDILLTHFEWANADEEVFMCLWKEVSVIVARRVLFKRNIMRPIFWRWITSKIYFFLSSAYVKWNWLQTVLTESSCCHELLNSVNDSGVEKLNHFCPWFYVRGPQSAFKLSPTDWRFAFPFKFGFQKLIII